LWRIPEGVSFEQAAALGGIPGDVSSHRFKFISMPIVDPSVFQTAAHVLYTRLNIPTPWPSSRKTSVSAGDSILIWSGAASVSFYAIQIAKVSFTQSGG